MPTASTKTAPLAPAKTGFAKFYWRVTATHVVTYFVAGVIAYMLFDYKAWFETGPLAPLMRPVGSRWVAAGPGLQVVRGLIFALALYPFRRVFLEESRGWMKLWGLFLGLAILGTAGPVMGSVEGLIYTKLQAIDHLRGLPEAVMQTLAFAMILVGWYRAPHRAWAIGMGIAFGLVLLMSGAGLVLQRPEGFK